MDTNLYILSWSNGETGRTSPEHELQIRVFISEPCSEGLEHREQEHKKNHPALKIKFKLFQSFIKKEVCSIHNGNPETIM